MNNKLYRIGFLCLVLMAGAALCNGQVSLAKMQRDSLGGIKRFNVVVASGNFPDLASSIKTATELEMRKAGVTVIDARTHEFYNGSQSDGNPRSGHIPGAANLSYLDVVDQDNNKFKSPDALKELFRAAGLKPGHLMVSYCHIGQRATVLYFTAKMLGYDAKMYDGSWEDWSHRKDLPIVTGESPNKQ